MWFLDAQRGWAVGECGAIRHTDDGGQHWQSQTSGVTCRLATVCFLNEKLGWAAGGFSHPYAHTSAGVVLTTRDGGRTWTKGARLLLPAVRRLRFFNARHGWAVACPSGMYPCGVFVSDDAGRTWRPLASGQAAAWQSGDFADSRGSAGGARRLAGRCAAEGEIEASQAEGFGLHSFLQLRMIDARHGWRVGEGGLATSTADGGLTWQPPQAALPAAARILRFRRAGRPRTAVLDCRHPGHALFHSGDAGRTWSAFATGTLAPLRAITFADDAHGWAVGDLGTILATDNGGRNWQRQHAGGVRAAILGLFGDADEAPWELFARLGGEEGYLAARADPGPSRSRRRTAATTCRWPIVCRRRWCTSAERVRASHGSSRCGRRDCGSTRSKSSPRGTAFTMVADWRRWKPT